MDIERIVKALDDAKHVPRVSYLRKLWGRCSRFLSVGESSLSAEVPPCTEDVKDIEHQSWTERINVIEVSPSNEATGTGQSTYSRQTRPSSPNSPLKRLIRCGMLTSEAS